MDFSGNMCGSETNTTPGCSGNMELIMTLRDNINCWYWYGLRMQQRPLMSTWLQIVCLLPVLPPKARRMPMIYAIAWDYVDVCGLTCHQGPCSCEWPVQPPEATVISLGLTTTKVNVEICGTDSVGAVLMSLAWLSPKTRGISLVCAAT